MKIAPTKIVESVSFYPLSLAWAFGISAAAASTAGYVSYIQALFLWSVFIILMVITGMWRELKMVHHLVNSQRDDLVDRIDQLTVLLQTKDIDLPPPREPR